MDLNTSNLLGAGAFAGIIALFWQKVKDFISRIFGLLIIKVKLEGTATVDSVLYYIKSNYKYIKVSGEFAYSCNSDYIKPRKSNGWFATRLFDGFGQTMIWYGKGKAFFVNYDCSQITLSFVRGTLNVDDILKQSLLDYNNITNNTSNTYNYNRFYIRRFSGTLGTANGDEKVKDRPNYATPEATEKSAMGNISISNFAFCHLHNILGYTYDNIGQPKKEGAMNMLSLTQEAIDCFEEIKRWKNSSNWFKDRCLPYKRGILAWGNAGTGKTAYVRALGQELNFPVMSFDISTMTNKDFQNAWEESVTNTPCIVLIEDIDAVFNGRENIVTKGHMQQGLSFDCLLNTIDGVKNSDGVILIVTTNHIEHLDPAIGNPCNGDGMSTRPGRIDRAIEFLPLNKEGKIKMAERIFEGFDRSKWQHVLDDEHMEFTGAQFQEKCTQLALKLFWEEKT